MSVTASCSGTSNHYPVPFLYIICGRGVISPSANEQPPIFFTRSREGREERKGRKKRRRRAIASRRLGDGLLCESAPRLSLPSKQLLANAFTFILLWFFFATSRANCLGTRLPEDPLLSPASIFPVPCLHLTVRPGYTTIADFFLSQRAVLIR